MLPFFDFHTITDSSMPSPNFTWYPHVQLTPRTANLLITLVIRPFLIIILAPIHTSSMWRLNHSSHSSVKLILRAILMTFSFVQATKLCRIFIANYSCCLQSPFCIQFLTTPIYQKAQIQQSPMMQHSCSEPVMFHTMFLSSSLPSKDQSNFHYNSSNPSPSSTASKFSVCKSPLFPRSLIST